MKVGKPETLGEDYRVQPHWDYVIIIILVKKCCQL
jgi:hypothetical protein